MINPIYKKFLASATGLTGAILTGAVLSTNATAETNVKIGEPGTVVTHGISPPEEENGKVNFVVDASKVGSRNYVFSRRVAIIFEGKATPDRQCPYITVNNRTPNYKILENGTVHIETTATKEELDAVKKNGCLITDSRPVPPVLQADPS